MLNLYSKLNSCKNFYKDKKLKVNKMLKINLFKHLKKYTKSLKNF